MEKNVPVTENEELTEQDLNKVSGGINPQPLPPRGPDPDKQ